MLVIRQHSAIRCTKNDGVIAAIGKYVQQRIRGRDRIHRNMVIARRGRQNLKAHDTVGTLGRRADRGAIEAGRTAIVFDDDRDRR